MSLLRRGERQSCRRTVACLIAAGVVAIPASEAWAQTSDALILGVKLQAGGRWDRVRMCVATPPGAEGGPAFDISFFIEKGIAEETTFIVDVPVMRPILFGAAFDMLQLEPAVGFNFRGRLSDDIDWVGGPRLGVTLHYGPDYRSGLSGEDRLPSFFALGPRFGGYLGLDFLRPDEVFNFQLGLHPYLSPLIAVDDPELDSVTVVDGALQFDWYW